MADYTPELLIDGFRFLEGPRWHEGRLWMSDMGGGKVYTLSETGELDVLVLQIKNLTKLHIPITYKSKSLE